MRMPDTELLAFDAAIAELTSWVGGVVEVWVEFSDGPSHVAGMHGELRVAGAADTVDGRHRGVHTFTVGEGGWFRLTPSYSDEEGDSERLVQHVARPPQLAFDFDDGFVHVTQSSGGSAS